MKIEKNGVFERIACDVKGCKTKQPTNAEIIEHGGLIGLGWSCAGGRHLCPKHIDQ